jgi:3-methyladenine DNA glycosylase AlkD
VTNPAGGWNDFKASYDDPAKAVEYLAHNYFDWWQVIDATDGSIVAEHYGTYKH